jgi:4'-phosphopantetheinyl transferase
VLKAVGALGCAKSPLAAASLALSGVPDQGRLDVWTLRVADVEASRLDLSALDARERRRAAALTRSADRRSFMAAHVLLRELLCRRLGLAPEQVAYRLEPCPSCGGPNGRPALDADAGWLHFSTSRSGGLVLIGIASVPVGVDVEVFPPHEVPSEVSALLHADERSEISRAAPSERTAVFTRLWTRKEAYLKGLGTGIAHGLEVDYLGEEQHAATPRGWTVLDVPVAAGYAAAAAIACRPDRGGPARRAIGSCVAARARS